MVEALTPTMHQGQEGIKKRQEDMKEDQEELKQSMRKAMRKEQEELLGESDSASYKGIKKRFQAIV